MTTPKRKENPSLRPSSRFLTPARTTGLKRKISSPLTTLGLNVIGASPSPKVRQNLKECFVPLNRLANNSLHDKPVTSVENMVVENDKENISSEILQDGPGFSSKLSDISYITVPDKTNDSKTQFRRDDDSLFHGFVSVEAIISDLKDINSVTDEYFTLSESYEQTQIYKKKHKIEILQETSKIWEEGLKICAEELLNHIKSAGYENVDLATILRAHGVPFDIIGFNEEIMDFE